MFCGACLKIARYIIYNTLDIIRSDYLGDPVAVAAPPLVPHLLQPEHVLPVQLND